ncbi:MAG TPA: hypothetical protein VG651_23650 [Stellaceae bacterium]|nr:hypothetical protein [Stellaceae bacterium]
MDLQAAVAVAKQHVAELCAPGIPANVRLENFLYDDHLAVWTLTIGFALPEAANPSANRNYKIIRVSEANKSILSVSDR